MISFDAYSCPARLGGVVAYYIYFLSGESSMMTSEKSTQSCINPTSASILRVKTLNSFSFILLWTHDWEMSTHVYFRLTATCPSS